MPVDTSWPVRPISTWRLVAIIAVPLLYSRTGRMSEVAGHALVDAGYRNVGHLVGGTDTWVASSRRLSTG